MIRKFEFRKKYLLLFALSLGILASCGDRVPRQPERLPDDEIPAYREAVAKMAPYVELCDSAFSLNAPRERAKELGVPEKYYDRIKQELEYTNYLISEHNKKGEHVDLPASPFPLMPAGTSIPAEINKN